MTAMTANQLARHILFVSKNKIGKESIDAMMILCLRCYDNPHKRAILILRCKIFISLSTTIVMEILIEQTKKCLRQCSIYLDDINEKQILII
jgi:hypothetical protein